MGSFRQELDGHDRDCCTHNPSGAAVVSPAQKLCVSRRPKDKQHSGALCLLRATEGNKMNRGPSKENLSPNPGTCVSPFRKRVFRDVNVVILDLGWVL